MKITVIGGGSTYTPEIVIGFIDQLSTLPITELWLMDIDPQRLEVVGGFAQRIVKAKGDPFKVVLSTNQREAISGAAKFVDAMPFYRQTKQFARLGVDIPRHSMSGWAMAVAKALDPLGELFRQEIRSGPIINMDETTLQVLKEPGRSNTSTSYLWLFRGGNPQRPTVVFRYEPSRSGTIPKKYLGEFKGYIQTDAYSGYQSLGEWDDVIHVGCMAHIRRKFIEVQKGNSKKPLAGTAKEVLDLIGLLYKIEHLLAHTGHIQQEIADPPGEKDYSWLTPALPYPCCCRTCASIAADHA